MIINSIAQCHDGRLRSIPRVELLVLHHCSLAHRAPENPNPIPDAELTGPELSRRFHHVGLGTGGRTPYHVLVRLDGSAEQLLPLDTQGAHAAGHNWHSLGICYAGESGSPNRAQYEQLQRVCTALTIYARGRAAMVRHDSLANAHKTCPGKLLDLEDLKRRVRDRLAPESGWRCMAPERVVMLLSADGWTLTTTAA